MAPVAPSPVRPAPPKPGPAGGVNDPGYRLIGVLKLVTALLLAGAGFGLFRLWDRDLGEALGRTVLRFHLDPENRLIRGLMGKVSGFDPAHVRVVTAGAVFYAILEGVEGVGLLLRRRWAGALTILATALLLIPEVYELAHRVNAVRLAILGANLLILGYLVVKVRAEGRERPAHPPGPA